ncbi:MAG: hypothetical protein A2176_15675 [Spirochaetes bacterium RBG_13_51_14]|nr:MAG: hypothetical protein A2176_15675 [Spirochaetes bacterium RBG_13_51_14]
MGMELRDRKYTSRNVQYLHDQMLYAGAKISFMGVGLGARIGVMDAKRPHYRRVKDFDLQASYFSRVFGAELFYKRYGRYYIANSPYGIGRVWNNANSGSRMETESAGLNLFLFMKDLTSLNESYSYQASFEQTEKQARSAGAFMIIAGADYSRLDSGLPVVPEYARLLMMFLNLYGITGWRFIGFSFGAGFAYTLVLAGDFFIAPVIGLAVHPYQMEFFTGTGTKKDFRIDSLKGFGRICAGYNGELFFTSVFVFFESIFYPCYRFKAEIWTGDLNVGIFSGIRI